MNRKLQIKNFFKSLFKDSVNFDSSEIYDLEKLKKFVIESRIEGIFLELTKQNFNWKLRDRKILKTIEKSSFDRFIKTTENLRYLKEASIQFNNLGVDFLVLKGSYLTTNAYDKISHRPINDIDLFIDSSQNKLAIKALENIGLKVRKSLSTSDFHIKPMENFNKTVRFDIHNKLFKNQRDNMDYFMNKEEINIYNKKMYMPEKELFVAHLIEHGTSKGNFDVGIQYLFDLHYLLNKNNLNLHKLKEIFLENNSLKELQISNALLKEMFGTKILANDSVGENIIKASEDIIFGPFIHNKTSNLLQSKMLNKELSSIKFFDQNEGNKIRNTYKMISRFLNLVRKYFSTLLSLIFNIEYKEVLKAKIIINKYFHD